MWIRTTTIAGARWVGRQSHELSAGAGRAAGESSRVRRTAGWILEHLNGLRIVGVIVAALFLLFGGNLTGWTLLIIVIVLAVYLGILQLVAAWARKASDAGASVTRGYPALVTSPPEMGPLSLATAVSGPHTGLMAEIAVILGAVGIFVAGFVAWYTLWHRRLATAFERVPVGTARSALVVRRGAEVPGNNR